MKRWGLGLLILLCLTFSVAAAEGFTPIPWSERVSPHAPLASGYLPDGSGYQDASIAVRVETDRREDTNLMLVYITITDPSQLRTALATPHYPSSRVAPVSTIARQCNAVLAINGDYFNYHHDGVVIRNGKSLRMKPNPGRDTLIIDSLGDFTILSPTTQEALDSFPGEIVHAFCFGPGLVINGQALESLDTVKIDNGKEKKTQRIALGQLAPLEYLIIATEGPENKGSVGFDLLQMAALCKEKGCVNAYNLDGGSSSTIVLNNEKINSLSSGKIRSVGDVIYFATLVEEGGAKQ